MLGNIPWGASYWGTAKWINELIPDFVKIPSALTTDLALAKDVFATGIPVMISNGATTHEQLQVLIGLLGEREFIALQCTSEYPPDPSHIDLRAMQSLMGYTRYVGYSGHERGYAVSLAAVALGARVVERHITLDRTMWGSDHASSLEPQGMAKMIRDIRIIEKAMGSYDKKIYPEELNKIKKLRRYSA